MQFVINTASLLVEILFLVFSRQRTQGKEPLQAGKNTAFVQLCVGQHFPIPNLIDPDSQTV